MLPKEPFGPDELLRWLENTQLRNERGAPLPGETSSHLPYLQNGPHLKPVVGVLTASWRRSHTRPVPKVLAAALL